MKRLHTIALLLQMTICISCSKQNPLPSGVLNFRFENSAEDVEWQEVIGSRYSSTGDLFITANGLDYEQFHLELENIVATGIVQNVTSKNISYSNIYGFKTGRLQSANIVIKEINNHRLYGIFEAAFINSASSSEVIKAKGSFSILGYE